MKDLSTGCHALATGAGRANVIFCSGAASYVTGAILAVDGGFLAV